LASSTLSIGNSGIVKAGSVWFDYVVTILLENHGINQTYGGSCIGNCTYFNNLADVNSLAKNYDKGGVPGSLGDYIALTSGIFFGIDHVNCNDPPTTSTCGHINSANIVDRIDGAHLTWKAYMEDYPSSCGTNCSTGGNCYMGSSGPGHYVAIHNPFVYYQNIQNNSTRCARVVPANSVSLAQTPCGPASGLPGVVNVDDLFLNDLNSVASSSNYMFLSPNSVDDVHDCGDVSTGNLYLQRLIPQILSSTLFTTRRAALFITYDEQDGWGATTPQLYAVWVSHNAAYTQSAFRSIQPYTHFSSLRTIEDNWGLVPFFTSKNDGIAGNMKEFFK
jgi:acid phosphatase